MLCGEEGGVAGEQSLGGLLGAAPLSARCVTGNLRWLGSVADSRVQGEARRQCGGGGAVVQHHSSRHLVQ